MLSNEQKAREAERESKWREAAKLWLYVGGDYGREQSAVCKTIAEAVELGDRYRELVGDAHERWEKHEINNRELYDIQRLAHQQVYGK